MTPITAFDKPTLKEINDIIRDAITGALNARGLDVKVGGGRYEATSFTPKVTITLRTTADGKSAEEAKFANYASAFGFTAADYKKRFTFDGRTFELVGFNLNARKRPFIGRDPRTNKDFIFGYDIVRIIKGVA